MPDGCAASGAARFARSEELYSRSCRSFLGVQGRRGRRDSFSKDHLSLAHFVFSCLRHAPAAALIMLRTAEKVRTHALAAIELHTSWTARIWAPTAYAPYAD